VAELCVVTVDPPDAVPGQDAGLCVVAGDRPGLLAAITAAITASRLEICAAQIHSRRVRGGSMQAVDLFWVRDRGGDVEGVARALPKLERDLREVVAGTIAPHDLVSERPSRWSERPTPKVSTDVVVDDHTSSRHTIIEVLTKDRPGLLFSLAHALHELDLTIAVAKINTEGTRVIDVFYITETDGRKLGSQARIDEVRCKLLALLEA
jgi:[protein-PII] uridylyltransferase